MYLCVSVHYIIACCGCPFVSLLYPTGAASSRNQERRIVLCQPVHSVGKSLHPQHGSLRAWGYLTVRAPRGVRGGGGVGRDRTCVYVEHCLLLFTYFVTPNLPLPHSGHRQCVMLFRRFVSRNAAGRGRAVLEGVGLSSEAIRMCYSNSAHDEEEAVQSGLKRWRDGEGVTPPTWKVLFEAMDYAEIGVQHITSLEEELLKGAVPSVSWSTEHVLFGID